jgi:hypothetical protein
MARRVSSVGFVGNEGYLALLMALAAVASLGVALLASRASIRAAAWGALALFLLALALTRDITGWIALLVGALPFARARLVNLRSRAWAAAALLALIAAVMAMPALRDWRGTDKPGPGCGPGPGVFQLPCRAPALRGQRTFPFAHSRGQRGRRAHRGAGHGNGISDASRRGSSERLAAVDPWRLREVGGTPAGRGAGALPPGIGIGERAEVDLNLGRAYALAGNQQAASAAVLRAVWVSPALISALPEQVQTPLKAALAENARRLGSHRLAAPPPLPAGDRSD